MATKKSQRIGIWIIALTLTVGTLGGFLVMVLAPKNQATDQARLEQLISEYRKEYDVYQGKVDVQNKERAAVLSAKYYNTFKQYQSQAKKFDADSVKKLEMVDLKQGDGETITDTTKFAVYYMLWLPDGKIKEQSIADGALSMPLEISDGLKNASLIDGWKEGLIGMKIGGVRELTLPSDKAYKEAGTKDAEGNVDIPGNTPLKFVTMAIPLPEKGEEIAAPPMSDELKRLYSQVYKVNL